VIVKRNRPTMPSPIRRIVKRQRSSVSHDVGRSIVKRERGATVGSRSASRGRRVRRPHFTWRPSKGLFWAAGTLGVLALVGYSAYWTWTSPFFKVSNIEVRGTERMAASTVAETTGLLGDSMFNADVATAQEALYQQPLVSAVRIERQWPNSMVVHVEERKPWGTWEQSGVRYTIDREGVVLGLGAGPQGSPIIKSSELGNRVTGDRVNYQAVDATAEIYEKLPRQLGTTVSEVAFITGKGVQVTTANNQTALFGDSSSISYKLSVWAALQQEAQTQRINYTTIDLRYGNRPVLQ